MKEIGYTKVGDYYFPDLVLEMDSKEQIGKYGRMRLRYLKEHEKAHYSVLVMKNKLLEHLYSIDLKAYKMHDRLVKEYKEKWSVTEQLKETNQLEWVRLMNQIEDSINEVIIMDIVHN